MKLTSLIKTKGLLLFLTLASSITSSIAQTTNLVVNGSFEDYTALGYHAANDFSPGGEFGINNWTVVGGDAWAGNGLTAADGTVALDLTGLVNYNTGVTSDSFTTEIGALYFLSFSIADYGGSTGPGLPAGSGTPATVHVLINGLSLGHWTKSGASDTDWDWTTINTTFTATSNSTSLTFLSSNQNGGNNQTVGLDNVSVVAAPEPSSSILLGIGLISGLAYRRR